MGEAGPEAIMPLRPRGPDGKLGVAAGGRAAPVSVTVNIATPDAHSFRRSEAQVAATLARGRSPGGVARPEGSGSLFEHGCDLVLELQPLAAHLTCSTSSVVGSTRVSIR